MQFQIDSRSKTATRVRVVDRIIETIQEVILDNVTFSSLERASCPILNTATDSSKNIDDVLDELTDEEIYSLSINLEPYLVRLSAHPVGYKLVVALATILPEFLMENLVKKLSDNFFQLSETAAGAVCILEILGSNPADLQCRIVETYTEVKEEDGPRLISHMTGHHSHLVFQACLCLLGPVSIRPLLSALMSSITAETFSSLSRHKSMVSLIQHVARIDPPSLFVIAISLEKINCLFEEEFHDLLSCLICKGGNMQ